MLRALLIGFKCFIKEIGHKQHAKDDKQDKKFDKDNDPYAFPP
jgi:hypothetical protein